VEDEGSLRLLTKVARLYHVQGQRQMDIAARLGISQSRVSRLLQQAEESRVIRTVVSVPEHTHADLERALVEQYGLEAAYVVESAGEGEGEVLRDLAVAAAGILSTVFAPVPTIGWLSWSRTLRDMIDALLPLHLGTTTVVELTGDLGPPELQHDAARSTEILAAMCGADPVFLRAPGVLPDAQVVQDLLRQDSYVQQTLRLLDRLDIALLGIGALEPSPPITPGRSFFTAEQLTEVKAAGAVGEVCMRYLDAEGRPVPSSLDELTIGVTLDQLTNARQRWAVSAGARKHKALQAALAGGWVTVLVTDVETAQRLTREGSSRRAGDSA
jgi:DNA-binding transcriptional regulator LsrR (DeoR family)